ncbi:MAG: sensor histidine kinase [Candidatus Hodarchaeales archaeon]
MQLSKREIFLFSFIIAGIILAIYLYITLFLGSTIINRWYISAIIYTFYIVVLLIALISTWVFLKRISVLKELDRLQSIFLASVSHELRTPLTSIIGFTKMILKGQAGEINEEQEKQLNIVLNSANHLHELIDDVIDVNKIEANTLNIRKDNYDLVKEIKMLKDSFNIAAVEKGLEFLIDTPEKFIVNNDKKRITQILTNLIGNAVKFTEKGEISVRVQINDRSVEISVSDTGSGINKEDISKLFKPFSRIVKSGEFKEGTGLGLYISKKLATLLGGEIIVDSEVGRGSTFKLILKV